MTTEVKSNSSSALPCASSGDKIANKLLVSVPLTFVYRGVDLSVSFNLKCDHHFVFLNWEHLRQLSLDEEVCVESSRRTLQRRGVRITVVAM